MNRRHLCSLLAALAATAVIDAMAADPPMTTKEPRFPQLTVEQLNEQQKPLGEQILKVSSVGLGGPYNPLLRSPVLGQRMFDLLYYLRWNTSVPLRLNEFAILIIGRQWRSQVEWFAHAPLAIKAGLSPEVVAELKANKRPANMKPDEAVVYDFVTELSRQGPGFRRDVQAREGTARRATSRGSDGCRRNLRDDRDGARDGGRRRAARQGSPVQGRRTVTAAVAH